jgi:hypothetical protein
MNEIISETDKFIRQKLIQLLTDNAPQTTISAYVEMLKITEVLPKVLQNEKMRSDLQSIASREISVKTIQDLYDQD